MNAIPKPYTADTDAALEEALLTDGAFETLVMSDIEDKLRAGMQVPRPGAVFFITLHFEQGGRASLLPPRTVKFYARVKSDPGAQGGVIVMKPRHQAERAASALRRVRRSILN